MQTEKFATKSIVMDEKKSVLAEALAQVQQAAGSHTAVPHLTGLLNVQSSFLLPAGGHNEGLSWGLGDI